MNYVDPVETADSVFAWIGNSADRRAAFWAAVRAALSRRREYCANEIARLEDEIARLGELASVNEVSTDYFRSEAAMLRADQSIMAGGLRQVSLWERDLPKKQSESLWGAVLDAAHVGLVSADLVREDEQQDRR